MVIHDGKKSLESPNILAVSVYCKFCCAVSYSSRKDISCGCVRTENLDKNSFVPCVPLKQKSLSLSVNLVKKTRWICLRNLLFLKQKERVTKSTQPDHSIVEIQNAEDVCKV